MAELTFSFELCCCAPTSRDLPLAARVQVEGGDGTGRKVRTGGNKELVFDPGSRSSRAQGRDGGSRGGSGPGAAEDGSGPTDKKQKKRGMGGLLPKQKGGRGGRGGGRGRR